MICFRLSKPYVLLLTYICIFFWSLDWVPKLALVSYQLLIDINCQRDQAKRCTRHSAHCTSYEFCEQFFVRSLSVFCFCFSLGN